MRVRLPSIAYLCVECKHRVQGGQQAAAQQELVVLDSVVQRPRPQQHVAQGGIASVVGFLQQRREVHVELNEGRLHAVSQVARAGLEALGVVVADLGHIGALLGTVATTGVASISCIVGSVCSSLHGHPLDSTAECRPQQREGLALHDGAVKGLEQHQEGSQTKGALWWHGGRGGVR